jgi:predicted RecA/RadA family phage recombinase
MTTKYVGPGETIDWYNDSGSAVSANDVLVLGTNSTSIMGVALEDIASTATGAVAIDGVFTLAKVSAAAIDAGESVIWDASASAFDDNQATPATGDVSGCCVAVETKAATTTTVKVKLNVGIGTVA